jgi:5'-nucleotidase
MNKLILISNDDGVYAEGLRQLTAALRDVGEIVVFAPDSPRSGMSCAITTTMPVTCRLLRQEDGLTVYSCTGTPVDCVKLAVSEILPRRPDVLVAGINHGGNQGLSVHYSGTMGAAFEGCVYNIPSAGISMHGYTPGADFAACRHYARRLTMRLLKRRLPRGIYLNLNIPNIPEVKGLRVGRQTGGRWIREYRRQTDRHGNSTYCLAGQYAATGPQRPDNDVTLLDNGYASLVPCRLDVTDNALVDELKTWKL